MSSANKYQQLAVDTEILPGIPARARFSGDTYIRFLHAILGIQSEAGELSDILKKAVFYADADSDGALDREHIKEELGDLLWYISIAANAMNLSLQEVMDHNNAKLAKRYVTGVSGASALARADKVPPTDGLEHVASLIECLPKTMTGSNAALLHWATRYKRDRDKDSEPRP